MLNCYALMKSCAKSELVFQKQKSRNIVLVSSRQLLSSDPFCPMLAVSIAQNRKVVAAGLILERWNGVMPSLFLNWTCCSRLCFSRTVMRISLTGALLSLSQIHPTISE